MCFLSLLCIQTNIAGTFLFLHRMALSGMHQKYGKGPIKVNRLNILFFKRPFYQNHSAKFYLAAADDLIERARAVITQTIGKNLLQ